MSGPLSGIRVVDASNFVFGPVATQMLGDMGADVIKIEPPEGDPTRRIGQARNPMMGSFFLNLNRNKRSMVLDLKNPSDAEDLRALLATADVFVHNMRSTAIDKLGLSWAALSPQFPRLVYATAQGFGSGGRYFDRPAYDDVIQGFSGIAGLNQRMSGTPGYVPMLMTDKLCGVFLAFAVCAALTERERSGRAQEVQVPMFEVMASFNLLDHMADAVFAQGAQGGQPAKPGYARVFGRFHRPLRTQDGHMCVIANTDAQWKRLFELLGQPQLSGDARFADIGARMKHVDALYATVEDALKQRTTDSWLQLFNDADIPASPAYGLDDMLADPHLTESQFFQTFEHDSEGPLTFPGIPMDLSATPGAIRLGPPRLGQHTDDIRQEIGRTT